jgi:hypothetical protein
VVEEGVEGVDQPLATPELVVTEGSTEEPEVEEERP